MGRCKLKPDLIINLGLRKRHLLLVPDTYDVKRKNKSHETIGTLSKDVFEQRTSTGSEAFSLFICLDANKLVLLSFFSLLKTIYPRVSSKPLPTMQKVHFRLTSVAQKRCCLSSLMSNRFFPEQKTKRSFVLRHVCPVSGTRS